ncbi:tryptophan biosynthesis modulator TrpM [Streptomyces noursei]|uniref:tryptophan biosynthesis modulator TrpM n=1 Tax=Streptomyces noursei TaxID=1971 RepID=UPI0033FE3DC4
MTAAPRRPVAKLVRSRRRSSGGSPIALPSWHRGCRAPGRRIRGRRVRYHIGSEPGQINGMRWRPGTVRVRRRPRSGGAPLRTAVVTSSR